LGTIVQWGPQNYHRGLGCVADISKLQRGKCSRWHLRQIGGKATQGEKSGHLGCNGELQKGAKPLFLFSNAETRDPNAIRKSSPKNRGKRWRTRPPWPMSHEILGKKSCGNITGDNLGGGGGGPWKASRRPCNGNRLLQQKPESTWSGAGR